MAESSVVTLLFTDIVGSVALKSRLGDGASDDLRRRHFAALRDAVARHRGHEVKTLGDGYMVVFASPSDAVSCAVDIQRDLAHSDLPVALRVGLHVGEATHEEDDYFGVAVDVARRLCDAAQGGEILASGLVRALVSGRGSFTFTDAGPYELKGVSEPVPAYLVDWHAGAASLPFPAVLRRGWWGSYIGRASERAQVAAALAASRAGQKRVVVVAGEPGIGKTRLVAEVARDAHAQGAVVLFGRCDEGLAAPYQPFVEALSQLTGAGLADDIIAESPEVARLIPELVADAEPATSGGEVEQLRLFRGVDAFLARLSSRAPVVVVLDDLHWAERSTLMLLRHIARSQTPASLCLVATYRDTDLDRKHPLSDVLADLRRDRVVERVLLRGLAEDELAHLVADRAGHTAPDDLVAAVHTETQGNPFFAEEVLRHLVETGAISLQDGVWTTDRGVEDLGIPEGVRDVVGRRLARLTEDANVALQVASVAGPIFSLRTIQPVSGLARDSLIDAMDDAVAAGLVAEVAGQAGTYTFSHAIVRQTLYSELSATRRVQLHWRVGEALRDAGAEPRELAHHFVEGVLAGDAGTAARACLEAAQWASSLFAWTDALAHYERALHTLDAVGATHAELRYHALRGVLIAANTTSDYARISTATTAGRDLARAHGRGDWLAGIAHARLSSAMPGIVDPEVDELVADALEAVGPDETMERCMLLASRAVFDSTNGWTELAQARLDDARRIAERLDNPEAHASVAQTLVAMLSGEADLDASYEATERAIALWRGTAYPYRGAWNLFELARLDLTAGDRTTFDTALERSETDPARSLTPMQRVPARAALALAEGASREAKAIAAELRPLRAVSLGAALTQDHIVMSGRLQECTVDRSIDGIRGFLSVAPPSFAYGWSAILGTAYVALERFDDAREVFDALSKNEFAGIPRGLIRPLALSHVCELAAWLSRAEDAEVLLEAAVPYGGQLLVTLRGMAILGAADRAIGQLLTTAGRFEKAEERYRAAIALEERNRFAGHAAWTRYWYARSLAARGDGDRANALLDEAIAFAASHGMAYLEREARRLAAMG